MIVAVVFTVCDQEMLTTGKVADGDPARTHFFLKQRCLGISALTDSSADPIAKSEDSDMQIQAMAYRRKRQATSALLMSGMLSVLLMSHATNAAQDAAQNVPLMTLDKNRIMLDEKHKREVFRVFNPTSDYQTYRISIIDMAMDEKGTLKEVEQADHSARSFFRVGPRMGRNIPPNISQIFKVMLRKKGIEAGEYRSHIKVEAMMPPPPEYDEPGIYMRPNFVYTVPVFVRYGDLKVQLGVENIQLSTDDTGKPLLDFDLLREGNRSTYGTLTVTLNGEDVVLSRPGLAVYNEQTAVHFSLPLQADMPSSGLLNLTFEEDPAYGGDQFIEKQYRF